METDAEKIARLEMQLADVRLLLRQRTGAWKTVLLVSRKLGADTTADVS